MTPAQRRAQPGGELEVPNEADFSQPFDAARQDQWEQEYRELVAGGQLLEDGFDDEFWDCREPLEDTGVDLVERANRELTAAEEEHEQQTWFDWLMRMDS